MAAGATENKLLALLPTASLARLKAHLEPVHLEAREILFRTHDPLRVVYFPCTAVVSLVSRLESGQMLEVGLIGRDRDTGTSSESWHRSVCICHPADRYCLDDDQQSTSHRSGVVAIRKRLPLARR